MFELCLIESFLHRLDIDAVLVRELVECLLTPDVFVPKSRVFPFWLSYVLKTPTTKETFVPLEIISSPVFFGVYRTACWTLFLQAILGALS